MTQKIDLFQESCHLRVRPDGYPMAPPMAGGAAAREHLFGPYVLENAVRELLTGLRSGGRRIFSGRDRCNKSGRILIIYQFLKKSSLSLGAVGVVAHQVCAIRLAGLLAGVEHETERCEDAALPHG